ncbi:MAG: hypothetical protein U0984_10510 [Prosthecobacter sp.]|nr:hypothetical protein [Prosthecobacter sp.]
MNIRKNTLMLAAIAAFGMIASSCVVTEPGYAEGRPHGYASSQSYANYSVTLGDGYAGRGYYYGPPNTRYYSRQPGVTYYSSRESVPQRYWSGTTSSHGPDHRSSSYRHEVRTTSVPTTNYTLSLGDGYAGRGYYYGPPNTRYYDERPGVTYYRDRDSVPSQYRTQTTLRIGN